jgi:hypothetical protein
MTILHILWDMLYYLLVLLIDREVVQMSNIVLEPCPGIVVYENGGLELGAGRAWPGGRNLRYTLGTESLHALTLRDEMRYRLLMQTRKAEVYQLSLRHALVLYPTIITPEDFATAIVETSRTGGFRMSATLPFGGGPLKVQFVISSRQMRPIMVHTDT